MTGRKIHALKPAPSVGFLLSEQNTPNAMTSDSLA